MFIVYLSGKLEKWLTLRMESERHFLWRKRVTSWTRLLKVLVERLDSSLNLSHRLNWKVILENTGHQMDLILQNSRNWFPCTGNPLIQIQFTCEKQTFPPALVGALWRRQWFISFRYGSRWPKWQQSRKCGLTSIVCSHSLSQIIWEVRGVRGSHTAEVNYRPGHTQFKRVGGHTHPAGKASDFLTVKCTVNSPL